LLFSLVISALAAITAASFVLLVQAIAAQNKQAMLGQHRAIAELAKKTGGVLTPREVAEHFTLSYPQADHLLRTMVDDRWFKMKVDDREAELVFWFTELVEEPHAQRPRADSKKRSSPRPKPIPATSKRT
jgi:hypothetical protein